MATRNGTAPSLAVVFLAGALLAGCGNPAPDTKNGSVERTVRHYEQVERELLAADTADLTPGQRAARRRMIDELRAYRESRDFTVNTDFPGARMPYFVDDGGRRCAVAWLLHRSGRDDLVAKVAKADNHAYVSDLADDPDLRAWLDEVGVSPWEAARIQGPGVMPPDDGNEAAPVTAAPTPRPPESTAVTQGTPPASRGRLGGGAATGAFGGAFGNGRTAPATGGSATDGSWWLWWEMNKLDYLTANPLPSVAATDGTGVDVVAALRSAALKTLLDQLADDDPRVRAAAAVAVGRVGGAAAVEPLLARLGDSRQSVRERAILALGATGSEAAVDALLRIARTGAADGRRELSPNARAIAVLGLALLRRSGVERPFDREVAALVSGAKKGELAALGTAGLLHDVLAPGNRLEPVAEWLAKNRTVPDGVRGRAIERIGAREGGRELRTLQRALAGPRLELRRAAAGALGGVEHGLVLPRLMTAFELEREPLTRGLLLLAIADRGGSNATRFLALGLREDRALRPWAALALGLVARRGDSIALEELRKIQLPVVDRGAQWLALGLARDQESLARLREGLAETGSPRNRAYAATGLALLGGERARHALLERLSYGKAGDERSPAVRVVIAQSLGVLGHEEDSDLLLAALGRATRPEYMALMAVGLGYHGAVSTLDGLESMLRQEDLDPIVRATAVAAVGILLDRRPGLEMPLLSRHTNIATVPDWLYDVLQSTL